MNKFSKLLAQVTLVFKLDKEFGQECDWPWTPSGNSYTFYAENRSFSCGCAAETHCILRHFKPRDVIEIGSGNSSLVIAKTLSINAQDSAGGVEYIIVDAYPQPMIETGLLALTELVRERVELLDGTLFDRLSYDGVMFIDSGHVVRTGDEVDHLILGVFPSLAPSVIVHLHDIGLRYDHPKVYAANPKFRVFRREAYLLQALRCFNNQFEILLAMHYLISEHQEIFRVAFPFCDPVKHGAISGRFRMQRK